MGGNAPDDGPASRIQIRIQPDGRVYIEGLSAEILEVAASLSPLEPALRRRLALLHKAGARGQAFQENMERHDGDAQAGQ